MSDSDSIDLTKLRGNEHILLVDDELPILSLTKRILEKHGYTVTIENDGQLAFKRFMDDSFAFDLIISDVTMPKLTGDMLATKILAIRPDLPIFLTSGKSVNISKKSVLKDGVKAVLQKPITEQQLLSKIRHVLDSN